jgi:hypothetical protein
MSEIRVLFNAVQAVGGNRKRNFYNNPKNCSKSNYMQWQHIPSTRNCNPVEVITAKSPCNTTIISNNITVSHTRNLMLVTLEYDSDLRSGFAGVSQNIRCLWIVTAIHVFMLKNTSGRRAVLSSDSELNLLCTIEFSVSFYLVVALQKFDSRSAINCTPNKWQRVHWYRRMFLTGFFFLWKLCSQGRSFIPEQRPAESAIRNAQLTLEKSRRHNIIPIITEESENASRKTLRPTPALIELLVQYVIYKFCYVWNTKPSQRWPRGGLLSPVCDTDLPEEPAAYIVTADEWAHHDGGWTQMSVLFYQSTRRNIAGGSTLLTTYTFKISTHFAAKSRVLNTGATPCKATWNLVYQSAK